MSAEAVAPVESFATVDAPWLTDAAAAKASRHAVVVPLVRPVAHRVVVVLPASELASVEHLGVPCAARPSTGFRHYDGQCQCFFGGPAPVFPPAVDPLGA